MAEMYSTGLRTYCLSRGSFAQAMEDAVLKVYSGTAPATADAAETGTLLCTYTLSSATTDLLPGWGEVVKTTIALSATGNIHIYDVVIGGGTTITTNTYTVTAAIAGTCIKVAKKVAGLLQDVGLRVGATSATAVLQVEAPSNQSLAISLNAGATAAVTTFADSLQTSANDCIRFGRAASGVISKDTAQTWSGVAAATGTAGYYRLVTTYDTGALSTTQVRVQGTCGVGTGELQLSTTTFTAAQTYTIDNYTTTFPASE